MIKTTASLRFDTCSGHTDIPLFAQTVGTCIVNVGIDLFSDAQHKHKKTIYIEFKKNNKKKNDLYYNSKIVTQKNNFLWRILKAFSERYNVTPGWDINIINTLPQSTGLGTSATLTLSLITGLKAMIDPKKKYKPQPEEILKLAHQIEVEDLGITGGFQDYIAAYFGNLNYMDFNSLSDINLNKYTKKLGIKLNKDITQYFNNNLIVIINKNNNISSADIIEDELQTFIKNRQKAINSLLLIKKANKQMYSLLKSKLPLNIKLNKFGELMDKDWLALKSLSNKIGQGILAELENKTKPYVYSVRGQGAAANSLSLLMKEDCQKNIFNILFKYSEHIDILYAQVNTKGLTINYK